MVALSSGCVFPYLSRSVDASPGFDKNKIPDPLLKYAKQNTQKCQDHVDLR